MRKSALVCDKDDGYAALIIRPHKTTNKELCEMIPLGVDQIKADNDKKARAVLKRWSSE